MLQWPPGGQSLPFQDVLTFKWLFYCYTCPATSLLHCKLLNSGIRTLTPSEPSIMWSVLWSQLAFIWNWETWINKLCLSGEKRFELTNANLRLWNKQFLYNIKRAQPFLKQKYNILNSANGKMLVIYLILFYFKNQIYFNAWPFWTLFFCSTFSLKNEFIQHMIYLTEFHNFYNNCSSK